MDICGARTLYIRYCLTGLAAACFLVGFQVDCPGILVSAEVGYEGWFLTGEMVPVRVTIISDAEDDHGMVRLSVYSEGLRDSPETGLMERTFPLPGKASLMMELPLEVFETGEVNVQLYRESDGHLLWSEVFVGRPFPFPGKLVLGVGGSGSLWRDLSSEWQRPIPSIGEADLPRHPSGYSAVAGVLLEGAGLAQLTGDQISSLNQFIGSGGRVMILDELSGLIDSLAGGQTGGPGRWPELAAGGSWRPESISEYRGWRNRKGMGQLLVLGHDFETMAVPNRISPIVERFFFGEGADNFSVQSDASFVWNPGEALKQWGKERSLDPIGFMAGLQLPGRRLIALLLLINLFFGIGGALLIRRVRGSLAMAWTWVLCFGLVFSSVVMWFAPGAGEKGMVVSGFGLSTRWAGVTGLSHWEGLGLLSSGADSMNWEEDGLWVSRWPQAPDLTGITRWSENRTRFYVPLRPGFMVRLNRHCFDPSLEALSMPRWDREIRRLVWDIPELYSDSWILSGRGGLFPNEMDEPPGWSLEQLAWLDPVCSTAVSTARWNRHELLQGNTDRNDFEVRLAWGEDEWRRRIQLMFSSGPKDIVGVLFPNSRDVFRVDQGLGGFRNRTGIQFDLCVGPIPHEIFVSEAPFSPAARVTTNSWRIPLHELGPVSDLEEMVGTVSCSINWGVGRFQRSEDELRNTEEDWGIHGRLLWPKTGDARPCELLDYPFTPMSRELPFMGGAIPPAHDYLPHRMSLQILRWNWSRMRGEDEHCVLEIWVKPPLGYEHSWRLFDLRTRVVGPYAE